MSEGLTLESVQAIVLLIGVAILVVLVARRLRLPDTVGLVILGLVVGAVLPELALGITPEMVLLVLLPGIIFDAAYRTHVEELRQSVGAVLLLAVPGVVVVAIVVAVALHLTTRLAIEQAFLVGAIVAATDPVAVIATFRRQHAPRLLATVVETESLVNDGTGVVLFAVAAAVLTTGMTGGEAAIEFIRVVSISPLIGFVLGWIAARIMTHTPDHLIEVSLTIVLAYGSYVAAETLHLSGILSTVVAAVALDIFGRGRITDRARQTIDTFWEVVAFVFTAIVFVLVGLAIPLDAIARSLGPIVIGVIAVSIARAVVVYGLLGGGARIAGPRWGMPSLPTGWLHVLFWAGLRGVIAVALTLSIPASIADRDLVANIAFGIVLFTLLVQGATVGPFVAWALGRTPSRPPAVDPGTT